MTVQKNALPAYYVFRPSLKFRYTFDVHIILLYSLFLFTGCPTPPQGRKKFFLSPKSLRSPWGLRNAARVPSDNALSGNIVF